MRTELDAPETGFEASEPGPPEEASSAPALEEDEDEDEEEPRRSPIEEKLYAKFWELLDKEDISLKRGQKVWGVVLMVEKGSAIVDIGDKYPATLDLDEVAATWTPKTMSHVVYRGMQRFFRVIGDPVRGRRRVSLAAVETRLYHRRLRQMMEHRATVVATVVGVNRGGLLLEMDGIAGFCPSAQLALRPDQLAGLVGREMRFKVQTLDTSSFTCVLSQVRLLNEEALPEGSQVGDVVEGEVAQVRDFGAFLLVAGRSGLLPWQQVPVRDTAPAGAPLRVGERVRVRITSHDRVKGLLNLSMLAAQPDAPTVGAAADGTPRYAQPWLVSRRTYPISQMPLGENDDDDEEEGGVDLGDLPLNDGDEVAATSEPDAFDAPRTEPLSSEDAPVDRDAALPSWPAGFGPEPRNRARARQAGIRRRPTTLEELVADCQGETSAEDDDGLLDDGDDVDDAESELPRLGESEEEATKRRLLARLHKRFPQITRRFPSADPDSYFLRLRPRR